MFYVKNHLKGRAVGILTCLMSLPLLINTGCDEDSSSKAAVKESNNIDWAFVAINSNKYVKVSVREHEELASKTARVKGEEITGDLISSTTTCNDNGDMYDVTYDIKGSGLENAVFVLEPQGTGRSDDYGKDTVCTYGMNYLSTTQKVTTASCSEIDVKYIDDTDIIEQKGEFTINLDLTDKNVWSKYNCRHVTVKADTADKTSDVRCRLTDKGLSFESSIELNKITLEYETNETDDNGKFIVQSEEFADTDKFDFNF